MVAARYTAAAIAHPFDRTCFRLSVEILLQGLPHDFRPLAPEAFCRTFQLDGKLDRQTHSELSFHGILRCSALYCIEVQLSKWPDPQGHRIGALRKYPVARFEETAL